MIPPLQITNVWMRVNDKLQQEILDFWSSNNLLKAQTDAVERSKQVVLTVRSNNEIVGVTSADFIRFHQLNDNLFFLFRMAVLAPYRIPGLESKLIVETRELLEAFAAPQLKNKAIGMLTFVENPQVLATRNEAVWPASKMVYIGSDKQGRHIRVYYFKGAKI